MFTQFTCSKNIFFKIFWKWNVNVIVNDAQNFKRKAMFGVAHCRLASSRI